MKTENINSYTIGCIIAFLYFALPIVAVGQNMQQTITVERTVTPIGNDVQALESIRPNVVHPNLSENTLPLGHFDGNIDFTSSTDSINPYWHLGLPTNSPYRGYAKVGYLPTYNLSITAGYRFIDTQRSQLAVSARFKGNSWHSKEALKQFTVSENTFEADIHLRHKLNRHILAASANLGHSALSNPTAALIKQKQAYNSFLATACVYRNEHRFEYALRADLDHLAAVKPLQLASESKRFHDARNTRLQIGVHGAYKSESGHLSGVLDLTAKTFNRKGTEIAPGYSYGILTDAPLHKNSSIVSASPSFIYRSESTTLRLGIHLDAISGTDGSKFKPAPDILIAYHPTGRFALELQIYGGSDFNSLRRNLNYSIFAPAFICSAIQHTPLNATITARTGGERGVRTQLQAGYNVCNSTAMPVLHYGYLAFMPIHLKNLWGEASAGYRFDMYKLDLSASLRINSGGYTHADPNCADRARWIAGATVKAEPIQNLSTELSWQLRGNRRCYMTGGNEYLDLRNINKLYFKTDYDVNERLSLALELSKYLGKRALILPGLQTPSLCGLLSATYRF